MVSKRNFFITGCAGYIGSTLAGLLLQEGYKVSCVDKLMHTGRSLLHLLQKSNFEFINCVETYETTISWIM